MHDPYGPGYPPPLVPARKTHVAIWVGVAVVVVAAVIGAVVVFTGSNAKVTDAQGTSGRTLRLPATLEGKPRITSLNTTALKQQLGQQLSGLGANPQASVAHAQVAVYGPSPTPDVVFIGIAVDDVPRLKQETQSEGVKKTLQAFMAGANQAGAGSSSAQAYPPGPKQGYLRCSTANLDSTSVALCGWGDESIFALTIIRDPVALDAAAATTRALREAAEQ